MKKLRVLRSFSVVGLLVGALVVSSLQVQGFHEPDLKTHLERLDSEDSAIKQYDAWSKENLYAPFALAYMKFQNIKFWSYLFGSQVMNNEASRSISDLAKASKCGYDITDMDIQDLQNACPAAREALIKKYAARYEECRNIAKEQKLKFDAKQKAKQQAAQEKSDSNNN